MKSAITVCHVPEAREGPFVLRDEMPVAFAMASEMGFDAVELFLPGPDFIATDDIASLAAKNGLSIAAIGTGAGMLRHGHSITNPDDEKRAKALEYVFSMIDFGGRLNAPVIIGSMQGKVGPTNSRTEGLKLLSEGLVRCSQRAATYGVPLIYEPLNRYETNLFNRLADAARFIEANHLENVVLLADLFHMNIEEADLPAAILAAGKHIGHVHFADSNRQAMGSGHTDARQAIAALLKTGYTGYLSAEIFPLPDPESAARQTIQSIRSLI